MNDDRPRPPRTNVLRFARTYARPLRERFPVEDRPADEMMDLLEQADRRRASCGSAEGG